MQAKSGPQAADIGCGVFGAFSLVIDSFMGHCSIDLSAKK
jgi:hypothetical protein